MINLPTNLPPAYRYSYTARLFAGTWRHSYYLVGSRGAVSLNVSGPHHYDGRDNWSAGLETHYRSPPEYMANQPPSHDECHVLKCPCWHDGTSLYASEVYLPMVMAGEHERVFRRMAEDANGYFAIKCDEAA